MYVVPRVPNLSRASVAGDFGQTSGHFADIVRVEKVCMNILFLLPCCAQYLTPDSLIPGHIRKGITADIVLDTSNSTTRWSYQVHPLSFNRPPA